MNRNSAFPLAAVPALSASHLASNAGVHTPAQTLVRENPESPNGFCKTGCVSAELFAPFLRPHRLKETARLCQMDIDFNPYIEYNQGGQEVYAALKIIGERMRGLRESVKLSQMKMAKEFGISQPSLARYEMGDTTVPPELLLQYADYFDVSMDYIFGRTENPKGAAYENHVNIGLNNPEMARFVEMCFEPGSVMNERLKDTLVRMLSEVKR